MEPGLVAGCLGHFVTLTCLDIGCPLFLEGQPFLCSDKVSLLLILHLANCYVATVGVFFFSAGSAEGGLGFL